MTPIGALLMLVVIAVCLLAFLFRAGFDWRWRTSFVASAISLTIIFAISLTLAHLALS